jgi:hypothetical protein
MSAVSRPNAREFANVLEALIADGVREWNALRQAGAVKQIIDRFQRTILTEIASASTWLAKVRACSTPPSSLVFPLVIRRDDKHYRFATVILAAEKKSAPDRLLFQMELVVWHTNNGLESFGLRIEPPDAADHAHSFPHVQICKSLKLITLFEVKTSLAALSWLSDSYPAPPLLLRSGEDMIFALLLMLYGNSDARELSAVQKLRDALGKMNVRPETKQRWLQNLSEYTGDLSRSSQP